MTLLKGEKKELHSNWSEIPDHPYTILIIRSSGSGKINSLLNLINQQPGIDKIRGRKLNILLTYINFSYFAVPKGIRLNCTHYFLMKIPNNKNFIKLHLMIHQISTLKTL